MLVFLQNIESPAQRSKLEKLYFSCRDKMYAVAYRVLQNGHDAEDAVHQAFVRIAESGARVETMEDARAAALAMLVTERIAIDLYRRRKRMPILPLEEETVGLTVEYSGGNDLARCMAALPTSYRQVLLLKHHHGYTTKEIARIMGISEWNVLKTEQRAKAKLEKLCKEAEIL